MTVTNNAEDVRLLTVPKNVYHKAEVLAHLEKCVYVSIRSQIWHRQVIRIRSKEKEWLTIDTEPSSLSGDDPLDRWWLSGPFRNGDVPRFPHECKLVLPEFTRELL